VARGILAVARGILVVAWAVPASLPVFVAAFVAGQQ
jgi:hypothetical protein